MKIDATPDNPSEPIGLRALSKAIFGNRYLLEVALEIAQAGEEPVYAARIARAVGIADNQARDNLRRLASAGFLVPHHGGAGDLRNYYLARPTKFWELCRELSLELAAS